MLGESLDGLGRELYPEWHRGPERIPDGVKNGPYIGVKRMFGNDVLMESVPKDFRR